MTECLATEPAKVLMFWVMVCNPVAWSLSEMDIRSLHRKQRKHFQVSVTQELCDRDITFLRLLKNRLSLHVRRDQAVKNSGGRHSWGKDSVRGDRCAFLLSRRWVLFRNVEGTPTKTLHKPSQEAPEQTGGLLPVVLASALGVWLACSVALFRPILPLEMPSEHSCAD